MQYVPTALCGPALMRRGILTCVTTQLNLEDIMLSVKCLISQRDLGWWLPGHQRREEIGSSCLIGTQFPFFKLKRVLEIEGGDGGASGGHT